MPHFLNRTMLFFAFILILFELSRSAAVGQSLPEFRTPPAPATPHINGPKVYGAKPGHPFIYRIPCTGVRPIQYSVRGLPSSLKLDGRSGIISGQTPDKPGEYSVTLEASNSSGKDARHFTIVVGKNLGLTPQMGWNDWYTYYEHISDADIRRAADAMVSSGMANYGYQYVDIDDCWATKGSSKDPSVNGPARNSAGDILANKRFPDMRALTDYVHTLGLKAGIYSSPGPLTCAKYEGSYQHEQADAQQFSKWGFDLLKYDWCGYQKVLKGNNLPEMQEPYRRMGSILTTVDRDVVFNMCQYGMADVAKWGRQVGGHSWRTTGDLGVVPNRTLPGFYSIAFANAALDNYAGPGGWNDPDYILLGTVGDANNYELPARPTKLTAEEQYSYMSMWSLMAAPLFFSGDMTRLDAFTLNVLCNSEVIDIDQDSLGKQGKIVRKTNEEFILAKTLDDESMAVGLFNLSDAPRKLSVSWIDLGISGRRKVRDVWRQHNIGSLKDSLSKDVPSHGVMMVRLIPD